MQYTVYRATWGSMQGSTLQGIVTRIILVAQFSFHSLTGSSFELFKIGGFVTFVHLSAGFLNKFQVGPGTFCTQQIVNMCVNFLSF